MLDSAIPEVERELPEDNLVGVWSYKVSDGTRSFNIDRDETGGLCFQQKIPGDDDRGDFFVSGKLVPEPDIDGNIWHTGHLERSDGDEFFGAMSVRLDPESKILKSVFVSPGCEELKSESIRVEE